MDEIQYKFQRRNRYYWVIFSLLLSFTILGLSLITVPNFIDITTHNRDNSGGKDLGNEKSDVKWFYWIDNKKFDILHKWVSFISNVIASLSPIITAIYLVVIWRRRRLRAIRKMIHKKPL
jgi:hypothetical protein